MPAAPCEGASFVSRTVVITKKRRRCRRRARAGDTDGPPAAPPHPATRVPAHQRLGPQPVMRVPVHRRLGQRRTASAPGGRHRRYREPGSLPRRHVPLTAVPVDADGFTLVQSHRHGRRHAPPHPRRQWPVRPSLVGLCFNCLAGDHIAARCTFPSRCLFYLSTEHRARSYKHDRPPQRPSLDRVREPPRRGLRRRAAGGKHGCAGSHLRRLRLGHHGEDDNNGGDGQDAGGVPEVQLEPKWDTTFQQT